MLQSLSKYGKDDFAFGFGHLFCVGGTVGEPFIGGQTRHRGWHVGPRRGVDLQLRGTMFRGAFSHAHADGATALRPCGLHPWRYGTL